MKKETIKSYISIASFVASVIIGFIALFLPPTGIIDASVLWFVAQLLCFTAGILGINLSIDGLKRKVEAKQEKNPLK